MHRKPTFSTIASTIKTEKEEVAEKVWSGVSHRYTPAFL
jgi:flagellar motor switch protein FliG